MNLSIFAPHDLEKKLARKLKFWNPKDLKTELECIVYEVAGKMEVMKDIEDFKARLEFLRGPNPAGQAIKDIAFFNVDKFSRDVAQHEMAHLLTYW